MSGPESAGKATARDPDAAYDVLDALIKRYVGNSDAQYELRCAAAAYGLASARKAIDDMSARMLEGKDA